MVNVTPEPHQPQLWQTPADSQTFRKLCSDSWAVRVPRSIVTDGAITFGAQVVFAAACAWRDRGPGFGDTDDDEVLTRTAAATPPGGWPALVGVSPHTWRRWRTAAAAMGLIELPTGPHPLIRPMAEVEPGEQFSRVEIAVLFHRKLSQRARRVFVAWSLFRQRNGLAAVSVGKIGDDSGLPRRAVQRGMRELVTAGVLRLVGVTARGVNRYLAIKTAPSGDLDRPQVTIKTAPRWQFRPPPGGNSDRPPLAIKTALSGTSSRTFSGVGAEPENPPPAPSPVFIKLPIAKKGDEAEVTEADIDEWSGAYPGVDVRQQLRHMRQWCINHPRKCKTKRGIGAFITGWFAQEQNRGDSRKRRPPDRALEYSTPASAVVRPITTPPATPPPPPVATPESREAVASEMKERMSALHAINPKLAQILKRAWRSSAAVHETEEVA